MNPDARTPANSISALPRWAPAAVVGLSLVLVSVYASERPFTMDESFSMLEAIGQVPFGPGWQLLRTVASDEIWAHRGVADVRNAIVTGDNGNMAGYILVLRCAIDAFGTASPLSLAVVSIAGFGMTVLGTWLVGQRLFGNRVGFVAAALVPMHFGAIAYGTMLRGNAWAMAAGLFATLEYLKIIGLKPAGFDQAEVEAEPFRRHLAAYAAWSVVGLFAHFLTSLILLVHVVFAVATVRSRRTWARLALAGTVVILSVVPVQRLALASRGYGEVGQYAAAREHARNGVGSVTARSPGELAWACAMAAQFMSGPYMDFPPLLAFPASLAVLAVANRGRRMSFTRHGDALRLTLMLAGVAFVVAGIRLALSDSLFPMRTRYMLVSVPYVLILLALAFDKFGVFDSGGLFRRPAKSIATAYGLIALCVPLLTLFGAITMQKGDPHLIAARHIGERIAAAPSIRMTVTVPTLLDAQLIAFHLGANRPVEFEIEDQGVVAEVTAAIARIGIDHPVAVYYEFLDRYFDQGLEFRRPVLASETTGQLRYVYRPLANTGN